MEWVLLYAVMLVRHLFVCIWRYEELRIDTHICQKFWNGVFDGDRDFYRFFLTPPIAPWNALKNTGWNQNSHLLLGQTLRLRLFWLNWWENSHVAYSSSHFVLGLRMSECLRKYWSIWKKSRGKKSWFFQTLQIMFYKIFCNFKKVGRWNQNSHLPFFSLHFMQLAETKRFFISFYTT